jgi:hypothetical protein
VAVYSTLPTTMDPSLGLFIPANAKYSDKEIFRKFIRRQNQYSAQYRYNPMDGIDGKLLSARTAAGKSIRDELIEGAKLTRIDSCTSRSYTGRYNCSTTEDNYIQAVEWIDTKFPLQTFSTKIGENLKDALNAFLLESPHHRTRQRRLGHPRQVIYWP